MPAMPLIKPLPLNAHIEALERGIAPPLHKAITITTADNSMVIYVAQGSFSLKPVSDSDLSKLAQSIVDAVNATHGN